MKSLGLVAFRIVGLFRAKSILLELDIIIFSAIAICDDISTAYRICKKKKEIPSLPIPLPGAILCVLLLTNPIVVHHNMMMSLSFSYC